MVTGDLDGRGHELLGRAAECAALDAVVDAVRDGRSSVLVLKGEPGVGKSSLLAYAEKAAGETRVLPVAGGRAQMGLTFAGLHQLCRPLLGSLDTLPAPQEEALGNALGLRVGNAPDRFLLAVATLTLLSEVARSEPLVCLVDDAQWLDKASAQTLSFVARRLDCDPIAIVVATSASDESSRWAGLPELTVRGLSPDDAAAVLARALPNPLDPRVRDRLVAESGGNPTALWQVPRWLTPAELAFGVEPGVGQPLTKHMEEAFQRQLPRLPEQSRLFLLVAAAEPLGDVNLLWRAAARLGLGMDAARPAQAAGLFAVRDTVQFRHPLVRSAVYRSASALQRQAVHRALADETNPDVDPDRRAWHLAHAASAPDEEVAAALERSATGAAAHGGLSAAAALLEHAALLTPDASDRGRRELDAALLMTRVGNFAAGSDLLAAAEHRPLSDLQRAQLDGCRAQSRFAATREKESLPNLLDAAQRLALHDVTLAVDCYGDALTAAWFAGRSAPPAGSAVDVARAISRAPRPAPAGPGYQLLRGTAVALTAGYRDAMPMLRAALRHFHTGEVSLEEATRYGWLASVVAVESWDDHTWSRWTDRYLATAREVGALSSWPLALHARMLMHLFEGQLAEVTALEEELVLVAAAGQRRMTDYASLAREAFRGVEDRALPFIAAARADAIARGEGAGVSVALWAQMLVCNGLGRYGEAVATGRAALTDRHEMAVTNWLLVELVEAGVRAGDAAIAEAAYARLAERTQISGTEWALGVQARAQAQLMPGPDAESLYREAISRLERTLLCTELARARLLYGEWLRRVGRRVDAREQLRAADKAFTLFEMGAFAGRARRELAATGETPRKRTDDTRHDLTAQELHITRLAAEGRTNPEIGAELFISPRTVEWHLRKVFGKLDVSARRQLRDALERAAP